MTRVLPALLLLILLCACRLSAQDQFVPTNGPYSSYPTHLLATPNGNLFLVSSRHQRLFRSTDAGKSWTMLRSGYPGGVAGALYATADGTIYLAMVSPQGLYRSSDDGASWTRLADPPGQYQEYAMFASDRSGRLYLAMGAADGDQTGGGLYRSTDQGATWRRFAPSLGRARSIAIASDGSLLAVPGNYYGGQSLQRSTDDGVTWTQVAERAGSEMFKDIVAGQGGAAWAIADDGYHGVPHYSSDNGATWKRAPELPFSYMEGAFQMPDGRLLLGCDLCGSKIFRYAMNGTQWQIEELSSPVEGADYYFSPIAMTPDGAIYSSFGGLVLVSRDQGTTWSITGMSSGTFTSVAVGRDERVYVGVENGGVMRSTDQGGTWTLAAAGIGSPYTMTDIIADERGLLFATGDNGTRLYRSENDGDLWTPAGPEGMAKVMRLFIASSGEIYLSARIGSPKGEIRLYRSSDAGASWTILPSHPDGESDKIRIGEDAGGVLYLLGYSGLYRSADRGENWTLLKTFSSTFSGPSFLVCANGDLLLADGSRFHRSADNGATWQQQPPPPGNESLFDGASLLAVAPSRTLWLYTDRRKLYLSHDDGRSWNAVSPVDDIYNDVAFAPSGDIYLGAYKTIYRGRDAGPWSRTAQSSGRQVLALDALSNGTVFVSTFGDGISLSRNNGHQWFGRAIQGIQTYTSSLMAESEDTIWAGTSIGLFRTTDRAITWKHVSNAIPQTVFINGLLRDAAGGIYVGTFGEGVYHSTNGNGGWVARNSGLGNLFVKGLSLGADGHLFAATNGGIYRTSDGGGSWSSVTAGFPSGFYANAVLYREGRYLLAATGGAIHRSADEGEQWDNVTPAIDATTEVRALYAGADGVLWAGCDAGIFSSNDDGRTWEPSGLGDKDVRAFTENSSYLFAGTTTDGVWRMAKGVASAGDDVWEKVADSRLQALPNPSGGSLTFRFTLPDAGHATLDLYDQRGSCVARLLDKEMAAGEHVLGWESELPPGAYYCVLASGATRTVLDLLLVGRGGR